MIFDIDTIEDNPIVFTLRNFARMFNEILGEKQLKFKKLYPDVLAPQKAHNSDMCFDIYAYSDPIITDTYIEYKTGIIFEIPEKYDMLLYARSSISNYDLVLANSVGVVDSGYRNEILFRFKPTKIYKNYYLQEGKSPKKSLKIYKKGDKIGQATLVLKTNYSLLEVDSINSNTDRGLGGFGSSGK
jgi:dUTP pyrophosphatase